ncbi:MAG: DUF4065 domain-containing protein [Methanosarcinales archaeon]|nr:DUF4065 domain-containing protein [Methanosarcinales archaeon]
MVYNIKTIYDLANWFSSKSDMSHKKLQKLCYYAVAWHYALYDSQLVENDEFEAWIHGPVSPSLWHEYKDYVWKPLPRYGGELTFDDETDEFLQIIYNTYGNFSGHQLEVFTHGEKPWKEARKGLNDCTASNIPISTEIMKKYYRSIYEESQND